jgi:hypothetical protein
VRPHQVGNPDAVQYTPVFNDIPGWQLYHGPGFWAPVSFPLDDWFRIRVAFAGRGRRCSSANPVFLAARTWTQLASEPSGLADLSRLAGIRDGKNTVLARTTIHSERRQAARLEVGFSDRAVLYLGGRALYRGDDTYRSRDYRFLGSIGWYDSVYLPLAEGDNELVVAVSEDLGGWGVQARLPDLTGLSFV